MPHTRSTSTLCGLVPASENAVHVDGSPFADAKMSNRHVMMLSGPASSALLADGTNGLENPLLRKQQRPPDQCRQRVILEEADLFAGVGDSDTGEQITTLRFPASRRRQTPRSLYGISMLSKDETVPSRCPVSALPLMREDTDVRWCKVAFAHCEGRVDSIIYIEKCA